MGIRGLDPARNMGACLTVHNVRTYTFVPLCENASRPQANTLFTTLPWISVSL